ncbi:MAG: hypothetical protein HYZ69_03360 [Candidatus Colwellbacteria bacterium]|nr:hypothetical protein [Candidatus Colwellbacteria bacterium]
MNRQKAVLLIISLAAFFVAYPSLSLAQDQVQQNLTVEVVPADNECIGGLGLKDSSVECVYDQVSSLVKGLSGWINEYQKFQLEILEDEYPFYGVGIGFHYTQTETTDSFALYRPVILEVWKGSPADEAGLKSQDIIRRINDLVILGAVANKNSEAEPSFMQDQDIFVKETITNARDPFTMAVERDGQVVDVELSKTTLGQEVADVLRNNLAEIERRTTAVRDMVEELVRQVEVHKDDKEMLLNLYDQFSDLDGYQDESFVEILFVEADKWQR